MKDEAWKNEFEWPHDNEKNKIKKSANQSQFIKGQFYFKVKKKIAFSFMSKWN